MGLFSSGGNSGDLEIKVTVNADQATEKIKQVNEGLEKLGNSGSKSSVGVEKTSSSLTSLGISLAGVTAVLYGVGSALDSAFKFQNLEAGFQNLQKSVGSDSVKAMEALQNATGGMISKMDLFQSANQAVLLGVDRGDGSFAKLSESAVKLGKAMGITAKEALDSLTIGIGRQSKLVLDNLGIMVDAETAYKKYADSIGTTADKLTDLQKKTAFANEANQAITEKAKNLASETDNAADAYQRLKVAIVDQYNAAGQAIAQDTTLTTGLNLATIAVNNLDEAWDFLVESFKEARGWVNTLSNSIKTELLASIGGATQALSSFAKVTIANPFTSAKSSFDWAGEFKSGADKVRVELGKLQTAMAPTKSALDAFGLTIGTELPKDFIEAQKELDRLSKKLGDGEGSPGLGKASTKAKEKLYELIDVGKTLSQKVIKEELIQRVDELGEAFGKSTIDVDKLTSVLGNLRDAYIKAGISAKEVDSIISNINLSPDAPKTPALEKATQELPEFLSKAITESIVSGIENGLNSDTLKGLSRSVASVFANDFQKGIQDAFKGADGKFSLSNLDISQLGSSFASLGVSYGISSLTANLSDNKKDTQGGIIGGAILGASYGSTFGPYGTAIGAVVGAGAGYVAGTLGPSTNSDTMNRHDTMNYIEGLLAGKDIAGLQNGNIIEGLGNRFNTQNLDNPWYRSGLNELQQLNPIYQSTSPLLGDIQHQQDSMFTGEMINRTPEAGIGSIGGPDWATQYWDQFGQEGGQAFNALGNALSQMAGTMGPQMEQIGVILAENLGGNLDNARLMMQAMGIDAQDLENAFMQIGLSGEQSWQQVEVMYQQIDKLTGKGLIGLGDVTGALNQIVDSGGRGTQALFGLRNAGIEAGEKGGKSIADLGAQLIASGADAKEVNILMQALAGRGITSLDQLASASDRTLGGVTADMESLGFSFANDLGEGVKGSIEDIDKLRDTIAKMPDKVEKNLNIKVSTTYSDSSAKGALNQLTGNSPGIPRS